MKRISLFTLTMLFISALILAGCGQPSTPEIQPDETQPATAESVATPVPSPAPTLTASPTEVPTFPCRIVFDTDRDTNLEIYVMQPDGSSPVNLSNNPSDDFDPVWSPDGTQIAFASNRDNGTKEGGQFIYIMRADGSDVTQLSHQNESKFPDWSASGVDLAYSSHGEIYLLGLFDGTEVKLTDSPEWDEQPKFSPDGRSIAWLKDSGDNRQLYVMDLDGRNVRRLTDAGTVFGADWSVDGRILTNWDNPTGICHNCLINVDDKEIADAGGKGDIQQFLPFWTSDGDRVEMGAGDFHGQGQDDIFLVGENFPDLFFFLTNDAGNNRNPDTAALCGPTHGVYPPYGSVQADPAVAGNTTQTGQRFTIGYTGSINPFMQKDFDQACSELEVDCIHGENITELADKGVDAIVNASNRWDVMGSGPLVHDAIVRGIPVFVLNAESDEQGVYNLSAEHEIYTTTLNWMFQQMGGTGNFIYYNFGNSDYIQNQVEAVLKDYPGITAIKKDADYNGNTFTEQDITDMVASDPNLGAIWATENLGAIFWGINDKSNNPKPLTECMARKDELISWKNEVNVGSAFQCIAHFRPGGTAYEGIYVAYYHLSGLKFKPDAFFPGSQNTLKYDIPTITNVELHEWIGPKLEALRVGENQFLQLPPMTPDEIKEKWFLE